MRSLSRSCLQRLVLALLGAVSYVAAAPPLSIAGRGPATTQTSDSFAADIASGQRLFEETCVICHGFDGKGGQGGGAPLDSTTNVNVAIQTITDGRNNMPPFTGVLTPEQIRDVASYVVERLAAPPAQH